jgi:membrane-bound ClpP family serine protease
MNWSIIFTSVLIIIGWSGVLVEFVRPGWVLPGAAVLSSAPFLVVALWMLAIARRARRNKRAL